MELPSPTMTAYRVACPSLETCLLQCRASVGCTLVVSPVTSAAPVATKGAPSLVPSLTPSLTSSLTQTFLWLSPKESFICPCIEPFQLPSCDLSRVELSQSEIVHLSAMSLILHDCSIISMPCDLWNLAPLEKLYLI